MKKINLIAIVLTSSLLLIAAADTQAQVSNAAALFLRIAPGARAAAMGEAFVAVADDATATHWNPAGLGASPLANNWSSIDIPASYRPIRGVAALRRAKGSGYRAFDLWFLTAKGLIRFDGNSWQTGETFETRTSQTVRKIVSSYLSISDDKLLDEIIDRVAQANFKTSYEQIISLSDKILAGIPEDFSGADQLKIGLDSLQICYHLCRLNVDRVKRLRRYVSDALKDSVFSREELERIDIAVERSRTRFIPELLKLPYSSFTSGEITSIASTGDALLVGTTSGLMRFGGRRWGRITTDDGLPDQHVTTLKSTRNSIIVGTMNGVAVFNGTRLQPVSAESPLPQGSVDAIGTRDGRTFYAVVNDDLYYYDGKTWSNSFSYTVQVDDSAEEIAERLSIFGSTGERQEYLEKLKSFQVSGSAVPLTDSAGGEITNSQPWFQPGAEIRVPYLASLPGKVSSILMKSKSEVWLGTEYGIFHFVKERWTAPGYRDVTMNEGQTLDDIVSRRKLKGASAESYADMLRKINWIDENGLEAGTKLKVVNTPAASATRSIILSEGVKYFATEAGLLRLSGGKWERSNVPKMGHANAVQIVVTDGETWYVSDRTISTFESGRTEITLTHVKWLPELADDLAYNFIAGVFNVGDIGTVGINFTQISFGTIDRRDAFGNSLGSFESFDAALTVAYGTSLTNKLKGGVALKGIHSRLADQGTGLEKGSGTSTGFALDLGILYHISPKLNLGVAVTNLGPKLAYIDAAQADDLPRNLAVGLAYKVIKSEYTQLLITGELNKSLVGVDDGFSQEFHEVIFNFGTEFVYANLFALRGGYIYDREGQIKTLTLGAGLQFFDIARANFSYIPNSSSQALANTLRLSLTVNP